MPFLKNNDKSVQQGNNEELQVELELNYHISRTRKGPLLKS